jgi:diguanylate cyclase (GGDEF)-like protein/PAS domain S-box-containing protein
LWQVISHIALALGGGLFVLWWLLAALLQANLKGLAVIRDASRRIAEGDLSDRRAGDFPVVMPKHAPPELRETSQALALAREDLSVLVAALAEEKERWRVTLASVGDGVVVSDTEGRVIFMNQMAENLTGWTDPEARGLAVDVLFRLINEDTRQPISNPIDPCGDQSRTQDSLHAPACQTLLIRRDGSELAVHDSAAPVRDANGRLAGCIMVFRDDNERRAMVRELRWLAFHDPLTGLPNRRAMEGRLERALNQMRQGGREHTFCYIDLDQFKLVNDTCGHAAGDALLKEIATLMQQAIPQGRSDAQASNHVLARLGGDEFGLLLFDVDADNASRIAQGLILVVHGHRFRHGERSFNLGASIGIALLDKAGNVGEAMSQADTACYAAKAQGRNRVQVYTPGHAGVRELEAEMHWVASFDSAFAEGRFKLYRQRIVPVKAGGEAHPHYEILLRHLRADGKVEPPGLFLPAAERYGLAPTFDRWVLRQLLAYLVRHPQDNADYSINLSGITLSDPAFPAHVQEQIAISAIDPRRLTFEITETAVVHDLAAAQHLIESLSQIGCRFSLDDFGSGLSSFAYLKSLPVHVIKIDGAFVRDLADDRTDYVIVNAIAQIGRDLGRETVAEFVENDAILAKLVEIGVDYAQGYGIHMPEPLPES